MMRRPKHTRPAPATAAPTHHRFRPLLAVCTIALAACTSQPLVGQYAAPTTGCCTTVADHQFQALPLGQETEFSLAPTSPTLTADGRRGHFAGFSVPEGVVATAVSVKTYLSSDFLPKATAVAPELHFFDAQFRPLGKVAVADLQSDHGFWRGSVSGRAAVPRETRYIVVMASTGETGRALVRAENGTPYRLPPAALGDLSIRLFGERKAY